MSFRFGQIQRIGIEMHRNTGFYPAGINCSHDTILEDESSGTIVCTECGLVLEDNFVLIPHGHSPSFHKQQIADTSFFSPSTSSSSSLSLIKDLLHKWPQVEEKMIDIIWQHYVNVEEKIKDKKRRVRLLASITYHELSQAGYSCLPEDVAQLFGLTTSDVFHFQSEIINKTLPQIVPISSRYCALLDLPFKDKENIGFICNILKDHYNTNLKTLCLLVIYHYCNQKYPRRYNLRDIARTCHSNVENLTKVIKRSCWLRLEKEIKRVLADDRDNDDVVGEDAKEKKEKGEEK